MCSPPWPIADPAACRPSAYFNLSSLLSVSSRMLGLILHRRLSPCIRLSEYPPHTHTHTPLIPPQLCSLSSIRHVPSSNRFSDCPDSFFFVFFWLPFLSRYFFFFFFFYPSPLFCCICVTGFSLIVSLHVSLSLPRALSVSSSLSLSVSLPTWTPPPPLRTPSSRRQAAS